jgi:hypothetical protein
MTSLEKHVRLPGLIKIYEFKSQECTSSRGPALYSLSTEARKGRSWLECILAKPITTVEVAPADDYPFRTQMLLLPELYSVMLEDLNIRKL